MRKNRLTRLMKWTLCASMTIGTLGQVEAAPPVKSISTDAAWELALKLEVAGKGGWTTCYTFAKNLQQIFWEAGKETHIVIYDWTDPFHFHDRHAILVYRDEEGRYWGMDNRSEKPRWLSGTKPQDWIISWDPQQVVTLVADLPSSRTLGYMRHPHPVGPVGSPATDFVFGH